MLPKRVINTKFISTPLQGSDVGVNTNLEKEFTVILKLQRYYFNYLYVIVIPSLVFSLLPMFVAFATKESGKR